ncbi:MAG TPA: hypothetical protein VHN17_04670 [Steroidobacteraceae bacterium]|jgi:hypothetical protein|nr:hypothetical protein [Steroidobacteraceae bacterium]
MKIDHEYLKRLLHAFAEAPGPTTDINELEERGVPYDDPQFIFHMAILEDKGLVEQEDHDSGFGMRRGADGDVSWAAVPDLRQLGMSSWKDLKMSERGLL